MNKSPEKSSSSILSHPMLGLRRLMILTALAIAPGVPINAQAAESSAVTQAAESNNAFKVMSELIKMFGKDYKYAGKQKDGNVIQCAQGKTELEAKGEAEKRIKAITGENFKIKFTKIQLADGTWVVAGLAKEKSTFDVMSELIKEFGYQYKYAGKQKDGNAIQCAQGKTLEGALVVAEGRASDLIHGQIDTISKAHKMPDGTWIVAVFATPGTTQRKGAHRRNEAPQAIKMGSLGSTSGGGEVKLGEKKEKRITIIKPETSEETPNKKRISPEKRKIRSKLTAMIASCQTRASKVVSEVTGSAKMKMVIGERGNITLITIIGGKKTKEWNYFKKCLIDAGKTTKMPASNITIKEFPITLKIK